MAERRRIDEAPRSPPMSKLERFRSELAIDKDDLDNCVVRQPELYDHVAEAHQLAVAERDATKLDLEEAEAEEAQKIRERAAQMDEKITEGSVKEQLSLNARLRKLRRLQIEQKATVDSWAVLKESFQQRSYMLKELVPMVVARMFSSGDSVRVNVKNAIADRMKHQLDEERRRRGYTRDR